jgi:Fic family protein
VHSDKDNATVYEGPEPALLTDLMAELIESLRPRPDIDPLVRAAMAHLNLVMIHPFRDGNGRLARALQTLVAARDGIAEPAFSSIEEWLGRNTEDYYQVLAKTGTGHWNPNAETALWIKFNLRAHHMQAQTLDRRTGEAIKIWTALDDLISANGLHERVADILYDAAIGFRIRRSAFAERAQIEDRTATRDLTRLVDLDFLKSVGQTKARHYTAGPRILELRATTRQNRTPLSDPYPWLRAELRRP